MAPQPKATAKVLKQASANGDACSLASGPCLTDLSVQSNHLSPSENQVFGVSWGAFFAVFPVAWEAT